MYLKSLQLIGFKSFAEKTTLDFLPGVTAIVGPNGCGKSNIADALRWVLGEQSAKVLRGAEMADVIFNGTDGRKAIGMAEVSLTFTEVDPQLLSLPGVNLDYSEITITRRVYRDGTGEYLINKTPVRLRDIQGLFMDTGIGRSSYSLMAQGQIDQILSARPDDRRLIFEEAAGINKYKHQKKEALRKLEYTEANLVRLTDIIKEVKRQIISLQRQAGKARRYKELFDELKGLDVRLARHKYDLSQADITALEQQIAAGAARADELHTEILQRETQIADLRRSLGEIDAAISNTVGRDHELRSESDRHQQRQTTNAERIGELEQLIEANRREIAGAEEKVRVQEQELARLNAEFAQIEQQLAAEQAKLESQQDLVRRLDADYTAQNVRFEEGRSALFEVEREMSRHRNELAGLDQRQQQDVIRTARLSTEKLSLQDQEQTVDQKLAAFQEGLTTLQAALTGLRGTGATRRGEVAELDRQLSELTRQHETAATALSEQRARWTVLRQFFGAPDGRATLGQVLEVAPRYAPAIEAALNHNLRVILADDLAAARDWLGNGQRTIPVTAPELIAAPAGAQGLNAGADGAAPSGPGGTDSGPSAHPLRAETISEPGILAATIVVRATDPRFEPLLQALLREVVIAETLDQALVLRAAQPGRSVATLAGEFLSAHGVLSAVTTSHIAELSSLAAAVADLDRQVTGLAARRADLAGERGARLAEADQLRVDLHAREVEFATRDGEQRTLVTEQRDLDSKIHTVIFELNSIEQQDAEQRQRREELTAALQQAEARETDLRGQITAAQQAVDELRRSREEQTQLLTELRVSVGGVQHQRGAIQSQRDPISGRIADLQERGRTCDAEIVAHTTRIAQMQAEIAESEQKVAEVGAARAEVQHQLAGFQHQRREVATGIEQSETELRGLRDEATAAQEQKSGFDLTLAQKRMDLQNLKDRVRQHYQVDLDQVRPECLTITVADQGPAVTELVPVATDWEALEAQVAEMQTRLDAMGPVNVEAIQEFNELEERYKFLTQQHDDLVRAKEQLLQVIAKINTTTKQLFTETFEKVRVNFQTMFTELFGGGKANLLLLDENDVLESGIEIVAKPPGKQLTSITLLSGGEKTLTATALLFAIYMVKPSPFCVLDELDAPLDESNINRFIRILLRFIQQSQFVIITHNKRTIGMADALYGITMEEHGVSKVVSVKFSPREETTRKQAEKSREDQEARIDGSATVPPEAPAPDKTAYGVRPHEEDLRNDLLIQKESTVAEITDTAPIVAPEPVIGQAPPAIAAEVSAAVASAVALTESVEEAVPESAPPPPLPKAENLPEPPAIPPAVLSPAP